MKKRLLAWLVLACLIVPAWAETERGDLSARFAGSATLEYQGREYRLRNRLTTVLGAVLQEEGTDDGEALARMLYVLVIDDDLKTVTPVEIPVTCPAVSPVDGKEISLARLYGQAEDREQGLVWLLEAVNALLPDVEAEHYLGIELNGLTLLDGKQADDPFDGAAFKARARAIEAGMSGKSSREYSRAYSELGEYIGTDMKSGAVMKVLDKTERYDRADTIRLTGEEETSPEGETLLRVDTEPLRDALISVWYEENPW